MSLEKPPPSRYRVEEKDGRLIVHDSMAAGQVTSNAPNPQPRSALDGASRTAPAAPAAPNPAGPANLDSGKAKRGATVAAIGIFLALFLIFTGLWPIMAISLLVAPVRRQLRGGVLPAVKRYVEEGRVS